MSIRITTGMIANGYINNLNQSKNDLNRAQQKAYTYRAFNQVSDDPFAAGQTFQIRRATAMNENYQTNLDNVQSAITTAESTLRDVYSIMSNANSSSVIKAVNGTMNSDNRAQIAKQLTNMRDSILADMNQEYADEYLFSGAGTSQAPFSVDASGNLLYRGINVDTGENTNGASATINYNYTDPTTHVTSPKTMQINFGKGIGKQLDGYSIKLDVQTGASGFSTSLSSPKELTITVPDGKTKDDLANYLKSGSFQTDLQGAIPGFTGTTSGVTIDNLSEVKGDKVLSGGTAAASPTSSYVNLSDLANEKSYVDIGLGLNVNAIDQSAYNSAMPGINFIGYGTNSDGTPKNAYNLLTKMANILSNGSNSNTEVVAQMSPYIDSFNNAMSNLTTQQADVGSKMNFLTSTDTYLTAVNTNLQIKDEQVEFVDPSTAIVSYYMQQYSYQAALHTGNSILQPTLLDFMK